MKRIRFCQLIFILFSLLPSPSLRAEQSQSLQPDDLQAEALAQLDIISAHFSSLYEPDEFKNKNFGWDLGAELARARSEIQTATPGDIRAYQASFQSVFKSARDYHAAILFKNTESAFLPFRVQEAGGRYFVVEIDHAFLPPSTPLEVGDELLSFDGQSPRSAVSDVESELPTIGNPLSDRSSATNFLTLRSANRLFKVPKGPITIEVADHITGSTKKIGLDWIGTPEQIPLDLGANSPPLKIAPHEPSLRPFFGTKNGPLPDLGQKLWSAPETDLFRAYIFQSSSKHAIGYIRIPTYFGDVPEVVNFANLIVRMEGSTDALILDELNNRGGQSYYFYALLGYLITEPIRTPLFRMSVSARLLDYAAQENHAIDISRTDDELTKNFAAMPEKFFGFNTDLAFGEDLELYNHFLNSQWLEGRRITVPHYRRVETIKPTPGAVHYSKPILMLTNENDYSCADMFPALLQDLGRAKTFGARTAGAGGNVDELDAAPNDLGVASYYLTITSMLRADGSYLEDHGAVPDFPYTLSADDLEHEYRGYIRALQIALGSLL